MSKTKTLTLGGQSWEIPEFVLGQTIEIIPMIQAAMTAIANSAFSAETIGHLVDVVVYAIKLADKEFTKEKFLGLPVQLVDLKDALTIIATQAGMSASKGEDQGTPSPPTGTN